MINQKFLHLKKTVFFLTFLLLIISNSLQAGWVVSEKKTRNDKSENTTYYFQENKVKVVDEDFTIIMDVVKGKVTIINTKAKTSWSGSALNFQTEIKKERTTELEEFVKQLPPDEQAKYYEMKGEMGETDVVEVARSKEINPIPSGGELEVAGYPTSKYDVFWEKEFIEEIFIANGFTINGVVDLKRMVTFFNNIYYSTGLGVSYHEQYIELFVKGYPLKRIVKSNGGDLTYETTKVEKKDLDKKTFKSPSGLKDKPILEVIKVKQ